jgi:hypothetical protein
MDPFKKFGAVLLLVAVLGIAVFAGSGETEERATVFWQTC